MLCSTVLLSSLNGGVGRIHMFVTSFTVGYSRCEGSGPCMHVWKREGRGGKREVM